MPFIKANRFRYETLERDFQVTKGLLSEMYLMSQQDVDRLAFKLDKYQEVLNEAMRRKQEKLDNHERQLWFLFWSIVGIGGLISLLLLL